jgi:hypothetical protein
MYSLDQIPVPELHYKIRWKRIKTEVSSIRFITLFQEAALKNNGQYCNMHVTCTVLSIVSWPPLHWFEKIVENQEVGRILLGLSTRRTTDRIKEGAFPQIVREI